MVMQFSSYLTGLRVGGGARRSSRKFTHISLFSHISLRCFATDDEPAIALNDGDEH